MAAGKVPAADLVEGQDVRLIQAPEVLNLESVFDEIGLASIIGISPDKHLDIGNGNPTTQSLKGPNLNGERSLCQSLILRLVVFIVSLLVRPPVLLDP
jgi:hypothetical protein